MPAALATVRLSGAENATSFSQASFSRVIGVTVSPLSETRTRSVGAVIVFLATIAKSRPASTAATAPPFVTTRGEPDG